MATFHRQPKTQSVDFSGNLNFEQIVFRQINLCREARIRDDTSFIVGVEVLHDLLCSYWDADYEAVVIGKQKLSKVENPFDDNLKLDTKVEQARILFRGLLDLIHRSGFMPFKEVDGLIE